MGQKTKPKSAVTASKKKKGTSGRCSCFICFLGFIAIVFGATAVNLNQFVFTYNYHDLKGPGEFSVRDISRDLNSLLCKGYEVTPFLPGNVFLVKGNVKVDHRHRTTVRRSTEELTPDSLSLNNAFHLLEGSEIHVSGCKDAQYLDTDDKAKILIFKGDKSWDKWSKGKCHDIDCAVETLKIKKGDYCNGGDVHLSHKIKHRDTYYIALYKNGEYLSKFEAEATIKQTKFDLRHARERCHMTSDCYLNLTYGEDMDVVVQFPDTVSIASFGTECKYRTSFWVGIFAALPGWLILMVVFCFCCCVCGDKKKPKKGQLVAEDATSPSSESKADLLGNEIPPDYKSIAHDGNIQSV